jgi:CheY-like chemotaxis protein
LIQKVLFLNIPAMVDKVANILLVEDDYLDILTVERAFKRVNANHKLYVANDGKQALAMLRGEGTEKIHPKPSIIMLDINLPKMNGLEFLGELRKDEDLRDIKVFITTTSDHENDRDLSKQLGISGYIVKPVNFSNPTSSLDNFNLLIDLLNLKK